MVQSTITYTGELGCAATHGPSGAKLRTDAPKDNNGLGESFSPTDLVAAALGSCILTIMGLTARRLNVDMTGATARVDKEMVADPFRRIGRLSVHIQMPAGIKEADREKFIHAAHTCPVHKSLHPDADLPIIFEWG